MLALIPERQSNSQVALTTKSDAVSRYGRGLATAVATSRFKSWYRNFMRSFVRNR
jgi:hypothetical protein